MKIPEGAVYAGRPSQWGNPARIGHWLKIDFPLYRQSFLQPGEKVFVSTNPIAVAIFYEYCISFCERDQKAFEAWLLPLVGKDLCCWCEPTIACHTDVLFYLVGLLVDGVFQKPAVWPTLDEVTGYKSVV